MFSSLLLAFLGLNSLAAVKKQGTGPVNDPTGSKEPIITVPSSTTPNTGIGGSIQVPGGSGPAQMASQRMSGAVQYTIFTVREQDWDECHPAVPTTRPFGLLGSYVDTWSYDGTGPDRHNYHFTIDGNQEGTRFLIIVKTTVGDKSSYSKSSVRIGRAN